jgi:WD40 repeat protein
VEPKQRPRKDQSSPNPSGRSAEPKKRAPKDQSPPVPNGINEKPRITTLKDQPCSVPQGPNEEPTIRTPNDSNLSIHHAVTKEAKIRTAKVPQGPNGARRKAPRSSSQDGPSVNNENHKTEDGAPPPSIPESTNEEPKHRTLNVPQTPNGARRMNQRRSNQNGEPTSKETLRERARARSCATGSREQSGLGFRETVKMAMSRKSELLREDKIEKGLSADSRIPSNEVTTDATEELELLSTHLGRPQQENDDLDFFAEKRMLGSCEWLLDEPVLADFLQDPQQTHLLWCTGRPGSGKSVFASSVVNHLRENDAKCAFHFFRFGNEAHNSLSSFLFSVAYQFAELIPQYRERLNRMFDQGLSLQKSAPRLIWQKLFLSPLFKMDLAEPLYLVVDGLDECDASALLLKLFADVANSKPNFCLMLVSRKTQILSTAFDKLSKSIPIETFSLEDVDEDLRMYVEDEMQSMRGDQGFKDRIAERVLAKADGNFLWTNLVLKEVLQCHTETEIEDALTNVPEDLEQLYAQMDATLARTSRPADHAMARMILMWVVCSRNRLNLEQLGEALKPEYAEVLDLRLTISQVCGEFVVVDTKGTVSMVHATARDFLSEKGELNFYIPAAESHQRLFTKCVSELIGSSSKIQMGQFKPQSFLSYAAKSWAHHLSLTSAHLDQESLLLLAQLFRGPAVLSWVHLLSISGQLGVLVQASKILTTFLKKVDRLDADRSPLTHRLQEKDALSLWTMDLVRLVGKFGFHLKSQPKSIYKLVPAFSPPTSAIHKTFCTKAAQSSLTISGISNPSWDDCLAKFAVADRCLPIAITSVNNHFAILTSNGTVHLYHSSTLEEGRRFKHADRVLAWCFNQNGDKLVTYGFLKTIVWNVTSGLQLFSFTNPGTAKAITVAFTGNDDSLVSCSDDRNVRCFSFDAAEAGWQVLENVFGSDVLDADQHNSPRCAAFNALGSQLAVGYRGFALSVWSVEEPRPCLIGRCERQGSAGQLASGTFVDTQSVCWNTVTGHVLGVYNDGCVFKWHPFDGEYQESRVSSSDVKSSPDGKFFVTSSADGSLRVWDFHHFSPIYQLSCSSSVTDLAIDPVERRIYDIRESFCNIWEPNALLRLWETDDKASDTTSTRESSTQISVYSEASGEGCQPLTALAVDKNSLNFSAGNDEGVVTYFSRDGEVISELSQTFMTVEHICWSDNGTCVASSDLSRRVTVKGVDQVHPNTAPKSLLTVKIEDPIKQLLLSPLGEYLLVSTDCCLTIWSIEKTKLVSTRPQTARYYWTNSTSDPDQLIGFGYKELQISVWEGMGTTWQLDIDRTIVDGFSIRHGVHAMFPKPTAQFTTGDGATDYAVDKVLFTLDGSMALIETSKCSSHHSREKQFMLIAIDPDSIIEALGSKSMIIQPKLLPPDLVSRLGLPLGFVVSDPIQSARRKSFATSPSSADPTRKSFFNPQSVNTNSWRSSSSTFLTVGDPALTTGNEHVLAFLDHEYWVCTYVLADGRPGRVRRHHFLPRDWINMDWLELAVMRPDGTLLCPRNGEVAIVANGLKEECLE